MNEPVGGDGVVVGQGLVGVDVAQSPLQCRPRSTAGSRWAAAMAAIAEALTCSLPSAKRVGVGMEVRGAVVAWSW